MTPPIKPERYSGDNPFAQADTGASRYSDDNPFAIPDFSDVEGGADARVQAPPGLLSRSLTAVRELGHEIAERPLPTLGRLATRPLVAAAHGLTTLVEGEPAPVAAKIGYGPAVGLPAPGTIVSRENTPGAITPEEQRQAATETLANALAAAAFAPVRTVLTPALGRIGAGAVSGAAGGAAAGAASSPQDRSVGAVFGGALGGPLGALGSLGRGPVRARPDYSDVPYTDFELAPKELPPGPQPSPAEALASALEAGQSPQAALPARAASLDQRFRMGPPTVPVERRIAPPPPPIPVRGIPERLALPPARGPLIPPAPTGGLRPGAFEPVVFNAEGQPFVSPLPSPPPPRTRTLAPVQLATDLSRTEPAARRPIPAVRGQDDVVTLSDGSKYPVQYQVVEAADLLPSHRADDFQPQAGYPAAVQGRRYERNPDAQLEVTTRAQQLDPDKLLRDTGSAQGTPIVTPGGIALAGNQRTMMLQRAAALHPDRMAAYRQALVAQASRFGIDPAKIEGMKAPVLVRRLDRIPETDAEAMRRFNATSDVPEEKAQSAFDEGAANAAKLMAAPGAVQHLLTTLEPDQTVAAYLGTAPGRDFVTELVRSGVIPSHRLAQFQDARTGTLTPAGKSMIVRTLQQVAVGDPDVLARAPAAVVQRLDHALPSLVRVAGSSFGLSRDLAEAVDMLTTVQSHREAGHGIRSVADLVGQGDLLGGNDRVARAQMLAEFLESHGQRDVTEAFRKYGQLAAETLAREASQGEDLFGTTPLTPDDAFLQVFGPVDEAPGRVAERVQGYRTRAAAERVAKDPKEQFLAKHGHPSTAYLEARKYLGMGDALSAEDLRLQAASDRQAGGESRDLFAPGQEEMFGVAAPGRPAVRPPAAGAGQGDLLAESRPARYPSRLTPQGAGRDAGAVEPAGAGGGLPLGRGDGGRRAGAPEGTARADTGRLEGGVQPAAGDRRTGEGRLPDPTEFADAVARQVAEADSQDPAQQQLFQLVHAAATDLARVAEQTPERPLFSGKIPGLRSEPYSRTLLAELKRAQRARPLTGQRVRTVRDLAVAMQLYRDPRWETFRVIYVKQGRIVYAEAMGARAGSGLGKQLNSAIAILPSGEAATFRHIAVTAKHAGADGIYLQHNHPSGRPESSPEDRAITRRYDAGLKAAKGPALLGHVIIDDTEYEFLDAAGVSTGIHRLTLAEQRPTGAKRTTRIGSPAQLLTVANASKALQQNPDGTILIYTDSQGQVLSVQEIEPDQLLAPAFRPSTAIAHAADAQASTARDTLARWARLSGAEGIFAVTPSRPVGVRLRADLGPVLTDILVVPPADAGAYYSHVEHGGMNAGSVSEYSAPNPIRLQAEQQVTRVRETAKEYSAEAMPDDVAAAYRRRQAKIDFSGSLTKAAERANTGLLSSRIQRFGDAIANDKGPIERLGTFAERADPDFRPTQNPKYLLSYVKESAATIHRAITEGVPDPITREIVGPSYDDLFRPFGRDDALIRQALTYAVEKRAVGRGLDAYGGDQQAFADGQTIVRHGDQQPQLAAFATRLQDYMNALGAYAVRSGLWTPDQWAAMQDSDVLYIPYKRILDALANEGNRQGAGRPRGLANVTSGIKSFVGSRRALANPALAIAEYTDAIIRRADAYRVGHALFTAADRLGDYGEALLTPVESPNIPVRAKALADLKQRAMASADPELRAVLDRLGDTFTPAVDPRHPVIWRNEPDGSRRYAIVNAPDLYNAVAGMAAAPSVVQKFLDLTLLPARRIFTAATTGFVPRFAGGTNPARDIVDAFAKTQHGVTPVDLARGYLDALGEVVGADRVAAHLPALERALRPLGVNLRNLPALADRAARARRHGLGGVSMFGAATRPHQIVRRYAPTTPAQRITGAVGRYTGGDRSPLVAVERIFGASDLGPRLGEMAAAERNPLVLDRLRRGVWDAADVELYAVHAGRIITLDFNNQPGNAVVRAFGRYVPFARPALQSPVRYAEALARNPKRMFAFIGGLTAAAVGAWVLKHRSAAALEKTNDRPDSERASFLLFPLDDEARVTLRMPLGQEAAIVTSATTAILDAWMDEDPRAASTFAESMMRALPPGLDQWALMAAGKGGPEVPIPVLQQLQENDRNRRFFGDSPVEPERLQDVAPEERRYETTPSTYSFLARLTGSSPLKIQNVARGVLSQSEPLITRGTDVLADALMGASAPVVVHQQVRSSPFNPLSAFVASDPPYRTRSEDQYYALKDRYATAVADAKAALKTRDRSAVARMRDRGEFEQLAAPGAARVFAAADRTLGQLRALQHQAEAEARVGADPALTRQRMDQITTLRQQVYRVALRQLQGRPVRSVPGASSREPKVATQ